MRNSKSMMIRRLFRVGTKPKESVREMIQPVPNLEAIQSELDADSLVLSNEEVSVQDSEMVRPYSLRRFDAPRIPAPELYEMLVQACEQGNSVQTKRLLDHGLDVHARFAEVMYSGFTAIHVAALYGHVSVVETLLNHAANINGEDVTEKRRPLHLAAGSRQGSMVRFLIQHGAQVDAKARNDV